MSSLTMCACVHACVYVYMCMHVCACVYMHMCKCAYRPVHVCMCVCSGISLSALPGNVCWGEALCMDQVLGICNRGEVTSGSRNRLQSSWEGTDLEAGVIFPSLRCGAQWCPALPH